eukprot:9199322-Pyramimonas_sp.AAC.1
MDQGLDSNTTAAALGQSGDADEGSGGVDLVDIDAPPDSHPDEAEVEVSVSAAQRFKRSAASLAHLLTHTPKNPFCSACNWAKALRRQQRKARNKGLKVSSPYANPSRSDT